MINALGSIILSDVRQCSSYAWKYYVARYKKDNETKRKHATVTQFLAQSNLDFPTAKHFIPRRRLRKNIEICLIASLSILRNCIVGQNRRNRSNAYFGVSISHVFPNKGVLEKSQSLVSEFEATMPSTSGFSFIKTWRTPRRYAMRNNVLLAIL